jgi:hypothetical protein
MDVMNHEVCCAQFLLGPRQFTPNNIHHSFRLAYTLHECRKDWFAMNTPVREHIFSSAQRKNCIIVHKQPKAMNTQKESYPNKMTTQNVTMRQDVKYQDIPKCARFSMIRVRSLFSGRKIRPFVLQIVLAYGQ